MAVLHLTELAMPIASPRLQLHENMQLLSLSGPKLAKWRSISNSRVNGLPVGEYVGAWRVEGGFRENTVQAGGGRGGSKVSKQG